jgi:hypothetical protein
MENFVRPQTLHKKLVMLMKDYLAPKYTSPSKQGKDRWLPFGDYVFTNYKLELSTGEDIIPDIVDTHRRLAYEIHVKGMRKANYFDKLKDEWKGVNIFYTEGHSTETYVINIKTGRIMEIEWDEDIDYYE